MWRNIDDMDADSFIIHSVGWKMKENDKNIVLVPHYNGQSHVGEGDIVIPRRAILKQKRLDAPVVIKRVVQD